MLAGDLPGVAVHHHLKRLAAVLVGEQPQRREHVFEGLSGELLLGLQIALGVARYRRGAQGAGGRFHGLPRGLSRRAEVDLITLDHETSEVSRVVGHRLLRGKRLDFAEELGMDALRTADQLIVEEVIQLSGGIRPSGVADLPGLALTVFGVALGGVVVGARFGGPRRVNLGVECPVGDIETAQGVGHGLLAERIWGEPARSVPAPHVLPDPRLRHLHGQQALRPDGLLHILVGNEGGRSTELAVLGYPVWFELRNGLTTLAFDLDAGTIETGFTALERGKRFMEVVLDNLAFGLQLDRGDRAAEAADEGFLARIPRRFRPAGGAGVLRTRSYFHV